MLQYTIQYTDTFATWLAALRNADVETAITHRLDRIARGHFGDVKPVGGNVYEIRIHYGPGYRLYYTRRAGQLVILLCAGDKSSQARDIIKAQKILSTL